jgi:hypothetical protein
MARRFDRSATRRMFFEDKRMAVDVCHFAQNMHGLLRHFRTNAITRKDYDL